MRGGRAGVAGVMANDFAPGSQYNPRNPLARRVGNAARDEFGRLLPGEYGADGRPLSGERPGAWKTDAEFAGQFQPSRAWGGVFKSSPQRVDESAAVAQLSRAGMAGGATMAAMGGMPMAGAAMMDGTAAPTATASPTPAEGGGQRSQVWDGKKLRLAPTVDQLAANPALTQRVKALTGRIAEQNQFNAAGERYTQAAPRVEKTIDGMPVVTGGAGIEYDPNRAMGGRRGEAARILSRYGGAVNLSPRVGMEPGEVLASPVATPTPGAPPSRPVAPVPSSTVTALGGAAGGAAAVAASSGASRLARAPGGGKAAPVVVVPAATPAREPRMATAPLAARAVSRMAKNDDRFVGDFNAVVDRGVRAAASNAKNNVAKLVRGGGAVREAVISKPLRALAREVDTSVSGGPTARRLVEGAANLASWVPAWARPKSALTKRGVSAPHLLQTGTY